jgi:Ser/Thr protein kinase RdoA (MazF antagonist)
MLEESYLLNFIRENYGLSGSLNQLPSYIDNNFLFTSYNNIKYVVKISSLQTPTVEIELENAAMNHLAAKQLSFQTPAVIKSVSGKEILDFSSLDNQVLKFRIVSFLNGHLYSQVNSNDSYLHYSLGVLIANITKALSDFNHPQAQRNMNWDIAQLQLLEANLDYCQESQKQQLKPLFHQFLEHTKPALDKLPKQIIHNDANDNNLTTALIENKLQCVGVFDFGDLVYSQRICELAVAMAYALMSQVDIIKTAKQIIKGYTDTIKVSVEELDLLPDLIKARLLQSLLNSAKSSALNPDNEYLLISTQAAWELLDKIDTLKKS